MGGIHAIANKIAWAWAEPLIQAFIVMCIECCFFVNILCLDLFRSHWIHLRTMDQFEELDAIQTSSSARIWPVLFI